MTTSVTPLKPPYTRRPEIDQLEKAFIALQEDGALLYGKVGEIIGVDPQSPIGVSITTRARHRVLRDHEIVIECLRNEGFKRVNDPEKVKLGKGYVGKIRRTAKRGTAVVQAANYDKLGANDKVQFTLVVSWLGAIKQATQPQIGKEIIKAIQQSVDVRAGDVLQLMIKKANKE